MAILRCSAGTFYDVPDAELERYKDSGEKTPEACLATEAVDGLRYAIPADLAEQCRLPDGYARGKLSAKRRLAASYPTEEVLTAATGVELPVPRAYCGVWVNVWFNNWNNFWRNFWRNCWRNGYPPF